MIMPGQQSALPMPLMRKDLPMMPGAQPGMAQQAPKMDYRNAGVSMPIPPPPPQWAPGSNIPGAPPTPMNTPMPISQPSAMPSPMSGAPTPDNMNMLNQLPPDVLAQLIQNLSAPRPNGF